MQRTSEPEFDVVDYRKLLFQIVKQAVEDYIKLQHPAYRKKIHLQKAFTDAVDMFFDDDYVFMHIVSETGKPMTPASLLAYLRGSRSKDMQPYREWLSEQARIHWRSKQMQSFEIPTEITIHGYVYKVCHEPGVEYGVDYVKRIIYLDPFGDAQKNLVLAAFEISAFYEDSPYNMKALRQLAEVWYQTLKVNDCFR